jgi:hypothetical protein
MKRIHLFEVEDYPWFPNFIRICMTRYIAALHGLMGTPVTLAEVLDKSLQKNKKDKILDMCSGSGGPMLATQKILQEEYGYADLTLTLSDLYPNTIAAQKINQVEGNQVSYLTTPVDVTKVDTKQDALRTMICSLHHMKPATVEAILKDAQENNQPFCAYEISDNSAPFILWWTAIPFSFIMVFFLTPLVRPMTWQQIVFTYLIPIIPLCIAWDGAVSNARTYTLSDLDEILVKLPATTTYTWERATIAGKGGRKIYLLGHPV